MKPTEVLELIKQGNQEFVEGHSRDYFDTHITKQAPIVTLLACSDSRVQTAAIFPDAINKIFTIENIGNQLSNAEGSVDYGIYHLKTPVLLITGHSDCGAIKAFSAGYQKEPDSIRGELDSLKPAFPENNDQAEIPERIKENIHYQVNTAKLKYEDLIRQGELAVVGAYYDFANDLGEGHGKLVILNINGERL